MGVWQWRKSFGLGPFRINLSKRGAGYSVGIPGLRLGRSSAGKTYVSESIPGTGLRRITYIGGGKSASPAGGPVATPTTPGPQSGVPSRSAVSGSAGPGLVKASLAKACSVVLLSGRRLRSAMHSLTALVVQKNTNRQAAATSTSPRPTLPAPSSASDVRSPTPAESELRPVEPPDTPWWRQRLDP